ncbi:glycosyltransferase family 4 protein [Streptomyces sodiiphilus]|uniref:Glycosyltransferase family 4 protein n=1 Tax=Streptomyces sodiiphilus TaxID=226217 RepID=A0ABN2NQN0_9ACTN
MLRWQSGHGGEDSPGSGGCVPRARAPLHVVQLLGGPGAVTGAHVHSLAAGLVARGVRVTVCAPRGAGRRYDFAAAGARFVPLPRAVPESLALLRAVHADADLLHAHGLPAGLLATATVRRSTPLVVTWHPTAGRPAGVPGWLRSAAERWVAEAATVVLAPGFEQVARARRRGARDARLAPVALPSPRTGPEGPAAHPDGHKVRAELGAVDRPLFLAAGPLVRDQGHDLLLTASRVWREVVPQPLLVIAGQGPRRAALAHRITEEDLPVRLLGRREDLPSLLAEADAVLLAARRAGYARMAREALREGVPLVATAVPGLAEVVRDAAVLVPPGDGHALGAAAQGLLSDPERRAAVVAAGRLRAAGWPTVDRTVAQVLSVYDEFTAGP